MADGLSRPDNVDVDGEIAVELGRLADSAEALARQLTPVERRTAVQTWALAGLVALVIVVAILAAQNRTVANEAGDQARVNRDISAQIRDCLDPSGQCYKDSRSRTGEVEKRILTDQQTRSATALEVVCDLFDAQGLRRPEACGPDLPDKG